MGTLQFDDADEPRLQIVIITGIAQVQGVGLQRERGREKRGERERVFFFFERESLRRL